MKLTTRTIIFIILIGIIGISLFIAYNYTKQETFIDDTSLITLTFTSDKNTYQINNDIQISLKISNTNNKAVILSTAEQGISVTYTLNNQYQQLITHWTQQKTFSDRQGNLIIPAQATYFLNTTWQQTDNTGTLVGTAGNYSLQATLQLSDSSIPSNNINITLHRDQPDNLNLTLSTDKTTYTTDEQATITISITNNAQQNITLWYPTTQQADYIVTDSTNTTIYQWSKNLFFGEAIIQLTLSTEETQELLNTTWDFTNITNQQLQPGIYKIQAWTTTTYAYGKPPKHYSAFITPTDTKRYSNSITISLT